MSRPLVRAAGNAHWAIARRHWPSGPLFTIRIDDTVCLVPRLPLDHQEGRAWWRAARVAREVNAITCAEIKKRIHCPPERCVRCTFSELSHNDRVQTAVVKAIKKEE